MSNVIYEAQKRYAENQKQRGMTRVNLFVPKDLAGQLKAIAADMRSGKWTRRG